MSGLSTIGIISFGLALVAGRKRLPMPATGNTAFVTLLTNPLLGHFSQARLIDDGDTELARLLELAPRFVAGHHIIGLLRNRAGHVAAVAFDQLFRLFASHAWKRSGKDEGFAGKTAACSGR